MRNAPSFLPALAAVLLGLFAARGAAQCDPQWLPGDPLSRVVGGINGMVTWDPDGSGPLGPALTICGVFSVGDIADGRVAYFDGSQWHPLGTPPGGAPEVIAVHAGQLVIGTSVAISVWTGSAWQVIGAPAAYYLTSMTTYQGALIVAGQFALIDGVPVNNIAQWNGSSWSPLGAGVTGGWVYALAVFNGSLHVGGAFTTAGGVPQSGYAIWNGTAWAPAPNFDGRIRTFGVRTGTSLANSYLFAGGDFATIGTAPNAVSANRIARFTPTTNTWSDLGAGTGTAICTSLLVRGTGLSSYEVLAVRLLGGLQGLVQRFSAGTWTMLGAPTDLLPVSALVYYGGSYTVGQQGSGGVFQFVNSTWQPLVGPGVQRAATAVCDGGTDVVLADQDGVHRGGPGAWTTLPGLVGSVRALARLSNGDVVAGGTITMAGGIPASGVARWNGTSWSALGGGVNGTVEALLPLPNGEVVVGGQFTAAGSVAAANIARWTGSAWQPLGGGTNGQVRALLALPGGDIVAGGAFTLAGSLTNSTPRIARWNGAAWSAMTTGSGFDARVDALAIAASGDLVVGGQFTMHNGAPLPSLARWQGGGSWAAVPNNQGFIKRIVPLGGGALVVLAYQSSSPSGFVLRQTNPLSFLVASSAAVDAQLAANGDLLVAGSFDVLGTAVSQGFGRLTTPCPATVATAGAGCAGSTLTAATLPWAGSVVRVTATGLPLPAFALGVTGFAPLSPPLPLATVLPVALPGCALHATPDVIDLTVAPLGTSTLQTTLPLAAALAGIVLRQQVVALQFDANVAITSVTSTNALDLTVGFL